MKTSQVQVERAAPEGPVLQRKCSCGQHAAGGECESCRKKRPLQRFATRRAAPAASPLVGQAMASPGQPLDAGTRAFMEARFAHDFSRVRVHTDTVSHRAATALSAYAYTIGPDIFFGPGRYRPSTPAGRRLLAHELTHTIQQQQASAAQAFRPSDLPGTPLEREADRAAEAVLAGQTVEVRGNTPTRRPQRDAFEDVRTERTRPTEGGRIEVVRTLEERPCRRAARTEQTPGSEVLFFDHDARAFGIRYRYCRGEGVVSLDTSLDYGRLYNDARDLIRRLPQTALSGGDVLGEIRSAAEATSVSARAGITVTVSGTLRAEVQGQTEQGVNARSYEVTGLLRLTPGGDWRLELAGGVRIAEDLGGQQVTFTFNPRINIGDVQVGATLEQTEVQPTGGPATRTTTLRGTASVPIAGRVGLTISGSTESGGTFTIGIGTLDRSQTIPRVPQVECYQCICPPPLPHFACTVVRDPRTEEEVVQEAGHEVVQLHYQYNSPNPADQARYDQNLSRIVGLVSQNYTVQAVRGFASPEASVAYNETLSRRRAERARADLLQAFGAREDVTAPTLPVAIGGGELLGQGEGDQEVRNSRLLRELSAQLGGLREDEQFELLGVDPGSLDEAGRADLRARIEAFIQGREAGRALGVRARWERIFPFLRRVEVTLDRPLVTRPRQIPGSRTTGSCDAETVQWAEANMPPLPEEQRLPTRSGRC